MRPVLAIALMLAACSGDMPDTPDTCTGQLYDRCVDEHACMSQNCRPFGTIQVCTTTCSDTSPCPNDEDGNPVPCTNALCVPAKANSCVLSTE
ncbi:MAG TPA: hypothetical protein VGC41_15440 [Kofleriaceae bacterium]